MKDTAEKILREMVFTKDISPFVDMYCTGQVFCIICGKTSYGEEHKKRCAWKRAEELYSNTAEEK